MFGFTKKCTLCRKPIEEGDGIRAEVEIYGKVGTFTRDFCSEACLAQHRKITSKLMKNRRPVCTRCLR